MMANTLSFPQLYKLQDLISILRRSSASIWRDVKSGKLPKPIKVGSSTRWLASEIEESIQRYILDSRK
jgi:predicted DNA-binding transcriptional regulator AlpA